jgi:aerobic carbon-monoxide dehydrogenase medium subunit
VKRFEYFEPASLDEAVALMARYNGRANLLAGGTDLFVEIKESLRSPDYVINIKRIPGMGDLSFDPRAGLRIGALVTTRDLEISPVLQQHYAGLVQALRELGSIQVRNRATLAGNICRASPSADTLPPLIVDGASLRLHGERGERTVLMEEFFTGPGKTVLGPAELVTEIVIPAPARHTGKHYIKHGRRKAMELATVGVAVSLTLERNTCRDIFIGLGAVAPTPIRARRAEDLLRGKMLNQHTIEDAAEEAARESRPISNVRGSADYRREMVRVLTRRAIEEALRKATA